MSRRMIIAQSALIITFLTGCYGSMNVYVNPDTTLTRSSSITIIPIGSDPVGVQAQLEHLLMSRGFKIISEAVARDTIKYKDEIKSEMPGQSKAEASLERTETVRSAYVLRFNYVAFWDVIHWRCRSFSATVVDLNTGEVVASGNFTGSTLLSNVLNEFVDQLAKKI